MDTQSGYILTRTKLSVENMGQLLKMFLLMYVCVDTEICFASASLLFYYELNYEFEFLLQ